jgi:hypothetical protein
MDLTKIIEELRHEKERLDRVIASVEELRADGGVPQKKRRGRKFMSAEERREVSARMKKYWEGRLAKRSVRSLLLKPPFSVLPGFAIKGGSEGRCPRIRQVEIDADLARIAHDKKAVHQIVLPLWGASSNTPHPCSRMCVASAFRASRSRSHATSGSRSSLKNSALGDVPTLRRTAARAVSNASNSN